MRRRLFNLAAAVSLVLCVAMWVRSYRMKDCLFNRGTGDAFGPTSAPVMWCGASRGHLWGWATARWNCRSMRSLGPGAWPLNLEGDDIGIIVGTSAEREEQARQERERFELHLRPLVPFDESPVETQRGYLRLRPPRHARPLPGVRRSSKSDNHGLRMRSRRPLIAAREATTRKASDCTFAQEV